MGGASWSRSERRCICSDFGVGEDGLIVSMDITFVSIISILTLMQRPLTLTLLICYGRHSHQSDRTKWSDRILTTLEFIFCNEGADRIRSYRLQPGLTLIFFYMGADRIRWDRLQPELRSDRIRSNWLLHYNMRSNYNILEIELSNIRSNYNISQIN